MRFFIVGFFHQIAPPGPLRYTVESPFRGVSYTAETTFYGISRQIFRKNRNRPRVPLVGPGGAIL